MSRSRSSSDESEFEEEEELRRLWEMAAAMLPLFIGGNFWGWGGGRGGRCFEVELDQSDETL